MPAEEHDSRPDCPQATPKPKGRATPRFSPTTDRARHRLRVRGPTDRRSSRSRRADGQDGRNPVPKAWGLLSAKASAPRPRAHCLPHRRPARGPSPCPRHRSSGRYAPLPRAHGEGWKEKHCARLLVIPNRRRPRPRHHRAVRRVECQSNASRMLQPNASAQCFSSMLHAACLEWVHFARCDEGSGLLAKARDGS